MRAGVFADAVRKINLLEPEFVICVGDLIEGYTEDANELELQWSEFEEIVSRLETPFFHVAGNHDVSNALMLEGWRERFGPSYYHFVYKDVLFLCLDTESGGRNHKKGRISDEQLDYFREVLDKHRQARWTLVFLHKPVWEYKDPSWDRFEQLLADRRYTVFAGHEHQYAMTVRGGRRYIRLATTGGGSLLKGPSVGTFDHIVWVTMTDNGPRLANLMLDGIHDENVTPYAIAAMAKTIKKKLDAGEIVEFEAVKLSGDVFTGAKTEMKISNFAPFPMKVSGRFTHGPMVSVQPETVEATVLPLLGKVIGIYVVAEKAVRVEQVGGIEFEGLISYEFAGRGPVEAKVSTGIVVQGQEQEGLAEDE
jgi:hypothetical protein